MGALPPTSFGALLKHYRRDRHLTQEALAELAGLSTNAINSLERGVRQRPYPDTVARLAEALRLSLEERASLEMAARDQAFPGPLSSTTVPTRPADLGRVPLAERVESAALEGVALPAQNPPALPRAAALAPALLSNAGERSLLSEELPAADRSRQRIYRAATYWIRGLVVLASLIELGIIALALGLLPGTLPALPDALIRQHPLAAMLSGGGFVAVSFIALVFLPRQQTRGSLALWERGFSLRFVVANLIATSNTALLVLVLLVGLGHPSACAAASCSPLIPGTHDANLEVRVTAVQSTYFEIPGDPSHYSLNHLPTTIAVQPLDAVVRVPYRVVVGIQSVQQGRFGLIIHQVALKVVQVAPAPAPLNVWAQPTREYNSNPFQIPYTAELPGAVILTPPESLDVQLAPGEADDLDIEVTAKAALDLRFQIQVNYRVTNESAFQTVTLPDVFEVVFASAFTWRLYQLQDGQLVPSP